MAAQPDRDGFILEPGDELDGWIEQSLRDPAFRAVWEDMEAREELRIRLAELRKTAGLSLREVGRRMRASTLAVRAIEAGWRDPDLGALQRYARAVGARLTVEIEGPPAGGPQQGGEDGEEKTVRWEKGSRR